MPTDNSDNGFSRKLNEFLPLGLIITGVVISYLGLSFGNLIIAGAFILYGFLGLNEAYIHRTSKKSIKSVGQYILLLILLMAGIYMMMYGLNFIIVLPLIFLDRFLFQKGEKEKGRSNNS